MSGRKTTLLLVLSMLLATAAITAFVRRSQALPSAPRAIIWDRESCQQCRMAISDPHFAAQLQEADGNILDFDDPGCLIAYAAAHHLDLGSREVHAVYFHHHREDRWLTLEQAGFAPAPSPMGHGLGAVERGAPASISYGQAAQQLAGEHLPGGGQ